MNGSQTCPVTRSGRLLLVTDGMKAISRPYRPANKKLHGFGGGNGG